MLSAAVSPFWHGLGVPSGGFAAARNLVYRSPLYRALLQTRLPRLAARPPDDPWPANPGRHAAFGHGCYQFADQNISAHGGLPWFPGAATPFWIEETHGFSWLHDLATDDAPDMARDLVANWITHCGA